jgi:hypothetical protein
VRPYLLPKVLEQVLEPLVESQSEVVVAGHCGAGPDPLDVVTGPCGVVEYTAEEVVIMSVAPLDGLPIVARILKQEVVPESAGVKLPM